MQESTHNSKAKHFTLRKVSSDEEKIAFVAQLIEAKLPHADLGQEAELFLLFDNDNHVVGTARLEWYGQSVLLRSVSVLKFYQGKGIGMQILFEIENIIYCRQAKRIFLLTETAKNFFTKNGYIVTPRHEIPQEVLDSPQFASTCPSTATAMMKTLA